MRSGVSQDNVLGFEYTSVGKRIPTLPSGFFILGFGVSWCSKFL
jgi:hypothetical protein